MRLAAFALALLLYGLWGTPTPDTLGAIEILLAVLLVIAVGTGGAARPFGIGKPLPSNLIGAQALLLYGLSLPVLAGSLQGHAPGLILRDLIPFLFFLLPLFCEGLVRNEKHFKVLVLSTIVIGLCFAFRDGARFLGDIAFLKPLAADPLSYLANAPTVLFAGLMLSGYGGKLVLEGRGIRDIIVSLLLLSLAAMPFAVMALALQRASIGLSGVIILFWLALSLWHKPLRSLRILIPVSILGLMAAPTLSTFAAILLEKTANVGLNNRLEEAGAVWKAVAGNPFTLLFGLGWGGTFASPAVGGLSVNFAHSLPAAMLLKTGLIGVLLTLTYLAAFIRPLLCALRQTPILALALAAPFAIDTLFYAAYKSLDFGVILLVISSTTAYTKPRL